MHDFEYECPRSLSEAVALLAKGDSRPLAGGTDLIDHMRTGRFRPALVVDVKKIPELSLPLGEGGAALGIAALLKSAGLAASSGEGNRLIDGGGVRVDSNVVSDKGLKLAAGTYVLQVGKRKFARVTLA